MPRCPFCGRPQKPSSFLAEEGHRCACGGLLFGPGFLFAMPPWVRARWEEAERARYLQRKAERICALILREDVPAADLAIERARLREEAASLFPDKLPLYQMIYESRFDRLWEQFREPRQEAP